MRDTTEQPPRRRRQAALPLPMPMSDRLPPHSIESEQGVLGCILLSPKDCIGLCIERFGEKSEVFYDFRHQALYEAVTTMAMADKQIDPITLQQWLKDRNQLEALGGMPYIAGLMNLVPSAASLEYYLEIVEEKYRLRRMIQACTGAVAKVYDHVGEVNELFDQLGREVMAVCDVTVKGPLSTKGLVHQAIEDLEAYGRQDGKAFGIATGFPDFDKMTSGLQNGEMIVIAARPSMGKTSWGMNVAEHVAVTGKIPTGVFSLEMTARSLMLRMICSRARVNIRNVRDGFLAERDYPKLTAAAGAISSADKTLFIDDTPGLSILRMRAKARRMVQQHGVKLFVIDYLQKMTMEKRPENRAQEVAEISGGIKNLALELNVPVIVLAQLGRGFDKDKARKPRLSDLRESGAIEQDADLVGLLYKPAEKDDDDDSNADAIPVNMLIAKQRNGPTGDVNLVFCKSFTRFESASKVADVPTEKTATQTEQTWYQD